MSAPADALPAPVHGVVALGDSMTQGYGMPLAGLTCQSWAAWTAWAIADCITQHAVNGATVHQVARDQTPLLAGHRYRLGVAMLGANDLHQGDVTAFEPAAARIVAALTTASDLVVVVTLPRSLRNAGQPWRRTVDRIDAFNTISRAVAQQEQALLVEAQDELHDRLAMAPDHQHPTALGQLELAHLVTVALRSHGVAVRRPLPPYQGRQVSAVETAAYRRRPRALAQGLLLSARDDPTAAAAALVRRLARPRLGARQVRISVDHDAAGTPLDPP